MKPFIEVLLTAATFLLFAFGHTAPAIFTGMFAVILFLAPSAKKYKTPEQIMDEARGENKGDEVIVTYQFNEDTERKVLEAVLHIYHEHLTAQKVADTLVEYIIDHTGLQTDTSRITVLSYKTK